MDYVQIMFDPSLKWKMQLFSRFGVGTISEENYFSWILSIIRHVRSHPLKIASCQKKKKITFLSTDIGSIGEP